MFGTSTLLFIQIMYICGHMKFGVLLFSFIVIFQTTGCVMRRCKGRQCTVRMEHYHNGYEYRGVNLFTYVFKYKNPRYGKGYPDLVKDPSATIKR